MRPSSTSDRPATPSCPSWPAVPVQQISIETAQSGLDCAVLAKLEGKHIMLGCLDLEDPVIESPATIVARVKRALPYVGAERIILAPDCGMKYLTRDVAFAKMRAMVEAAALLRTELGR
jgi:5-methyltetrahydropteroyltriglutamate--homocysteine methyltransferase